jgi:hypothetical protein
MSDDSDQRICWLKKLGAFFPGPFTFIFTAGAVVLGAAGGNIVSIFNKSEYAYAISASVVGGAYILIIIVTIIIFANIFSKDRNKEISKIIQKQPEVCKDVQNELSSIQQVTTHLRNVTAKLEIVKFILSGNEVHRLEASVKKDMRIFIFTSKFILEKKPDFVEIINCNFRKGVKYNYLVPSGKAMLEPYYRMIKSWYSNFVEFTENKEKANIALKKSQDAAPDQVWNQKYIELIKRAKSAHLNLISGNKMLKEIKDELKCMFKEQLLTYNLNDDLFFVAVAMYELETDKWKALINLPTENQEDNYSAFCVSDANIEEATTFKRNIWKLTENNTPLQLPDVIFQ